MTKQSFKQEEKKLAAALAVFELLKNEPVFNMSEEELARTRQRLLTAIDARPVRRTRGLNMVGTFFPQRALAGAALAVLLLAGGGIGLAISSSLPGDPLYGLKTNWQEIRTKFALGEKQKVALRLTFIDARLDDVVAVRERQRSPVKEPLSQSQSDKLVKVVQRAETGLEEARAAAVRLESTGEHSGAIAVAEQLEQQVPELEANLSKLTTNGSAELRVAARKALKKLLESEAVAVKILATQEKDSVITEEEAAAIAKLGQRVTGRFALVKEKLAQISQLLDQAGSFIDEDIINEVSDLLAQADQTLDQAKARLEEDEVVEALLMANQALQQAIDAENKLEIARGSEFVNLPPTEGNMPTATSTEDLPLIDIPENQDEQNGASSTPALIGPGGETAETETAATSSPPAAEVGDSGIDGEAAAGP